MFSASLSFGEHLEFAFEILEKDTEVPIFVFGQVGAPGHIGEQGPTYGR